MDEDDLTPASRVSWAKRHSGQTWEQLAGQCGCSHSALVLWAKGQTDVLNAKARLVVAFARATRVSLHWLLTGEGERLVPPQAREHQLIIEARHIAAERPALAEGAYRMLLALEHLRIGTGG